MVLSERATFVWFISLIIFVIVATSNDVIDLSRNRTIQDGSPVEGTKDVEFVLPGKHLDSNAGCSCGIYGVCERNDYGEEICNCLPGYGLKRGICTECSCYWADTSVRRPPINCTFFYYIQFCSCPSGYVARNRNYCTDYDGCKTAICPRNSECRNYATGHKCSCKSGYRKVNERQDQNSFDCIDINECEEQNECPYRDTTSCINTQGSYYCVCKSGYIKEPDFSIENWGCLRDQTGWKIAYIMLGVILFFISLGLIIAIYKRRSDWY